MIGAGLTVPVDLDVADAVVVDESSNHLVKPMQAVAAAFGDEGFEFAPVGADVAGGFEKFVVAGPVRCPRVGTGVEQRLLRQAGAVAGQQSIRIRPAGTRVGAGRRQRHQPTS